MDGYDETTYGERFVDVYDDWYGTITDTEACVAALAAAAAEAAAGEDRAPRVLELGVGTGRLALPLAATGARVTGVDASAAMLDALAAKDPGATVRAVLGDMADPPLAGERFDLVVVAYNTFFNLVQPGAQDRCLRSVAALLEPGGRFVLEAFVPDLLATGDLVAPKQVTADKVVLSVVQAHPERQELVGQYVDLTESGIALRPWHIRWATPEQLDAAAARAGLVLERRAAGWDGAPFADGSPAHVSTYRRA